MKRVTLLTAPGTMLAVVLGISVASAQSAAPAKAEADRTQEAQASSGYSEAGLKFDIIEAQLQTLRKKMQLQSKRKAEQTKEWDEHYQRVKQHIDAWDDFVDSYNVE